MEMKTRKRLNELEEDYWNWICMMMKRCNGLVATSHPDLDSDRQTDRQTDMDSDQNPD